MVADVSFPYRHPGEYLWRFHVFWMGIFLGVFRSPIIPNRFGGPGCLGFMVENSHQAG